MAGVNFLSRPMRHAMLNQYKKDPLLSVIVTVLILYFLLVTLIMFSMLQ